LFICAYFLISQARVNNIGYYLDSRTKKQNNKQQPESSITIGLKAKKSVLKEMISNIFLSN